MSLPLNDKEAIVFAYRVALRQLQASDEWLDWEDYPNLTEQAFNDMDRHVQLTVVKFLRDALGVQESVWGIDSADLLAKGESDQ